MMLRGFTMRSRFVVALALVTAVFAGHGAFERRTHAGATAHPGVRYTGLWLNTKGSSAAWITSVGVWIRPRKYRLEARR